jgi:hypothetical protein
MVPPTGGSSPAPIDRPILALLRDRLAGTRQVERAALDEEGHQHLQVVLAASYYPDAVERATLAVRWYTNDDFAVHYREAHATVTWACRWDRHPNPHNTRDHFHPPPDAATPGEDASWPADPRDVLSRVLDDVERRIERLWES